jgi:hypothetical protein
MKKGRLLLAAGLLAVTSALLVAGTLPVAATATGASVADAGHGKTVRVAATYGKVEH